MTIFLQVCVADFTTKTVRFCECYKVLRTGRFVAGFSRKEMDSLQLVNIEEAMARVDNDKELYQELLDMFFDDPQFSPDELKALIAEDKKVEAAKCSHLLKGISGTLGGEKLFAACQYLEDVLKGKKEGDIVAAQDDVIRLFHETNDELKRIRTTL